MVAKTKAKKPVAKKKKPVGKFTLEVSVNDSEYKGKAKDAERALRDFIASPDFPFSVKTRVFIRFGTGKNLFKRTYSASIAKKLFSRISFRDTALEIFANKLTNNLV